LSFARAGEYGSADLYLSHDAERRSDGFPFIRNGSRRYCYRKVARPFFTFGTADYKKPLADLEAFAAMKGGDAILHITGHPPNR
jgi:hypothetical protein